MTPTATLTQPLPPAFSGDFSTSLQGAGLWQAVKSHLQERFTPDLFRTWFSNIVCAPHCTEGLLILQVQSEFASIWIQDNYLDLLTQLASHLADATVKVQLEVADRSLATPLQVLPNATSFNTVTPCKPKKVEEERASFNPKNTFKNFIVGPGNQLAHAASIAVANAPGASYNPLFLYGETGLGKTHLMHAVGQQVLQNKPHLKVAYISTEKFTNEFIKAIQENNLVKFRQRYRSVDVLLIDDIQFLSGKERIQEEFFHTFNDLFESQKQILLTSDRPAGEIAKLESRLISRFQWGLVTDIQAPDLETRMAILRAKSAAMNLSLPDDVMDFLAESVSKNVRRMEGALTRVGSYASLLNAPLTVPVAERLLQDILQEEAKHQITIEKIQQRVVEYFHVKLDELLSKRRTAEIAFARQIAMYLCRMLTQHSLYEIGLAFGGREHGTVIHACKTVENIMEQDDSVKRSVHYLLRALGK
jgi:chromosomal replication initiator protein